MNVLLSIYRGNGQKFYALYALWICVLSWICLCTLSAATECQIHEHDSNTDSERENKLLEKLKPLEGKRFNASDGGYNYMLGICTKADNTAADGVGVMQYTSGHNFSLGSYKSVGIMGGHNWVLLTYYNGEKYENHCNQANRTSHIMVICDPAVFVSKLRILEERRKGDQNGCFYLFEISSSVVCNPKEKEVEPPHSLSSGSVFCIIFFTCAGIYLLLGFIYQRIVVGGKGLEQIPNYSFWRSFGNLQADGCDYVCRSGPRQESHAYRGIDDRIRTDEERDDQLLNM